MVKIWIVVLVRVVHRWDRQHARSHDSVTPGIPRSTVRRSVGSDIKAGLLLSFLYGGIAVL